MNYVEDKFKIYIDIEKNIGNVFFLFYLYLDGLLLYNIDTANISVYDKNISIFDGENWFPIDSNGLIDTTKYNKICIEYENLTENILYDIEYKFQLNSDIIFENNFNFSIDNEKLLQQTVTIPFLIYNKYPTLYWDNSFDLDNDIISYEINIFTDDNNYVFNIENNGEEYTTFKIEENLDLNIYENVFYFWKVRAYDGFDYSDWSNLNCFLYINRLEMQLLLCKKEESNIGQEIYIKCDNQLLNQMALIRKLSISDLNQSIFVKTDNQLLNQQIDIFNKLISDLNQSIFVKTDNQLLNSYLNVVNQYTINLNQSIFVKTDNQLLNQQIAICSSNLKMMLWMVNTKLNQKINVRYSGYNNIFQSLQLRGNSNLNFQLTKIKKFEKSLNQTVRVQLPFYDELIISAYDNNNNEILQKEWITKNTNIYFNWTKYSNNDIYYKYNISMDIDSIPDKIIYNNGLSFTPNVSGIWFIKVRAYLKGNVISENDSVFILYINTKPSSPQPPFLIDGTVITENLEIYNTMPLITFNGSTDNDNDVLRYHIKISKDINFTDCYVDRFVEHSNIINYQLTEDELLPNAGLYYLYIATCDFTTDDIIKSEIPIIMQFRLSSLISILEKKLRIYYYSDSALLFMKLQIPRYNILNQKITVNNYFNNNILMKTIVYDSENNSDIYQEASVYKAIGLNQKITVYNNFNNLNQKILVNHLNDLILDNKIRVYSYNSDNFSDEEFPTRDVYQEIKVYSSTDNPAFTPQPLNMQAIVSQNYYKNIPFLINVWNMYHNPYYFDILQKIIVSNIVTPPSGILQNKITIIYASPPDVTIYANVAENVWQSEYLINYRFVIPDDLKFPVIGYYYEFDNAENTIPTTNSIYTTKNTLRVNLKDYLWRGRFYLHVRSLNSKGVLSDNTATYCILYNLTPSAPTLPLLVNGYDSYVSVPTINYTKQINFTWGESYDPDLVDKITYKLQISNNQSFSSIYYEQNDIVGNFYGIVEKTLIPDTYYWRVCSNDGNENSKWSFIGSFFINSTPDSPKKLIVKNSS